MTANQPTPPPSRATPPKNTYMYPQPPRLHSQTGSQTFFEDSYLNTANRLLTRLMNFPYSPLSDYAFRQVWGFSAYRTAIARDTSTSVA